MQERLNALLWDLEQVTGTDVIAINAMIQTGIVTHRHRHRHPHRHPTRSFLNDSARFMG